MQLRSLSVLALALSLPAALACSSSGANNGPANTAGEGATGGAAAGSAQGGTSQGGDAGQAQGGTSGGSGGSAGSTGGSAGATGGSAGSGGGTGGSGGGTGGSGGAMTGVCPPGPFETDPVPQGASPMRVAAVPPSDAFNNNGNDFGIIEGPVWFEGALYVSEIASGNAPPPARVLKVTTDGQVSVAIPMAGTNGLAIDPTGALLGASHTAGAVQRLSLTGAAPVNVVSMHMGQRFNSPNDIAVRADGNLYFTDPDYQAPNPRPQSATRAYRVAPGSNQATPIVEGRQQPNGIMVSLDGSRLFVSAQDGVFAYPIMADGSVGTGARFGNVSSSDGLGLDCAGNLYTTTGMDVIVLSPMGMELDRIAIPGQTTNVAFGGPERKTLYVTTLGTGTQRGLFRVELAVPGLPF